MSITHYRSVVALGVILSAVLLTPLATVQAYTISKVTAEEQGDFVLEPGKMEVVVNPGEKVTKYIAVTNRINDTIDFQIEVEDFVGSRDRDTPVTLLGDDRSPTSFKDGLIPEISAFSLKFGERITLPITIDVPVDAQPGGYYASVLVSNAPSKDQAGSGDSATVRTKIVSRLGVLFFIRVRGPVNEDGALQDFKVAGPKKPLYSKAPEGFEILFENTGTIHLVPYGLITIKNTFGSPVATLAVDAYFSLPSSLRYRDISWPSKGFHIGRYTATLNLNRGYGDIIDTKVISFWIIPWKVLIITIGVIILLTLLFYFISSRFEFRRKK
jgi:hypothetical protein